MKKYNILIIEAKQCIPYLNLSEQTFYNTLWEWTYEDDLWDWIEENNPDEEELKNIVLQFINENMFHKYEDDDVNCFAFINDEDYVKEYQINEGLFEFVYAKIKEYNDR